jgi:hypothetical protein
VIILLEPYRQRLGSAIRRWLSGVADGISLSIADMYAPFRAGDLALLFDLLAKLN